MNDVPTFKVVREADDDYLLHDLKTDWRDVLRSHGFKSSDGYGFMRPYPDPYWKNTVELWAQHGWNPEPQWQGGDDDEIVADPDTDDSTDWIDQIARRDIRRPDLINFTVVRSIAHQNQTQIPATKLDAFLRRLLPRLDAKRLETNQGFGSVVYQEMQDVKREMGLTEAAEIVARLLA